MLQITIPSTELYNDRTGEFYTIKEQVLQLEHSLVALSKWESFWCKPFLSKDSKTFAESVDYIRCMTLTQNVNPNVYRHITNLHIAQVSKYIELPMTATTFSKEKKPANREIITSEIIYYWMTSFNIPFECQKWHLNRLLAFINVCNLKNKSPKKRGKKELMNRNTSLNAARREAMNTTG